MGGGWWLKRIGISVTSVTYSVCCIKLQLSIIMPFNSAPLSNIPMRLVSPDPSLLSFAGRFEVYHDGQWGSVCDDYFGQDEADIACFGLNYTDGALCYATSGFSQGSGKVEALYVWTPLSQENVSSLEVFLFQRLICTPK